MSDTGTSETAAASPVPGFATGARHAWRTFSLTRKTSPGLTLLVAVLTLFVALLPALALYLSKLVIDGVVTAIDSASPADRDLALLWVTAEAAMSR